MSEISKIVDVDKPMSLESFKNIYEEHVGAALKDVWVKTATLAEKAGVDKQEYRDMTDECESGIYCYLNDAKPGSMQMTEEVRRTNEGVLCRFLSRSLIIAYFGGFDNDKALSAEFAGQSADDFLSFAFEEVSIITSGILMADMASDGIKEKDATKIGNNLLSRIRDISLEEYKSEQMYKHDLKLILCLCQSPENVLNENVWDLIVGANTDILLELNRVKAEILLLYKTVFSETFGLRPYYGVLTGDMNAASLTIDKRSGGSYTDLRLNSFWWRIWGRFYPSWGVTIRPEHQFNTEAILNSDTPIFFPAKILEFALGRQITEHVEKPIYKASSGIASYDAYSSAYIEPFIDKYLRAAICDAFEKRGWASQELLDEVAAMGDAEQAQARLTAIRTVISGVTPTDVASEICQKLKRSMCTIVVITRCSVLKGLPTEVAFRVVDVMGTVPNTEAFTKEVFTGGTSTESFSAPLEISKNADGSLKKQDSVHCPYPVYEFKYVINAALAEAEPLFAYTAVEMFKEQGLKLTWSHVLLGENEAGTPVFGGPDGGDLPITGGRSVVHWLMAGSRSGKGLMTMTLIASAIAEGKSIYYIDRKPDMASMFHYLTKGNMFLANGGVHNPEDAYNQWGENDPALADWHSIVQVPDYVQEATGWGTSTYIDNSAKMLCAIGDFIYWRAMMFCLCIVKARAAYINNPEIYEKLGGGGGALFVFDEIKSWFETVEDVLFGVTGFFVNDSTGGVQYTSHDLVAYKSAKIDMKAVEAEMQAAQSAGKEAKIAQMEKKMLNAQTALEAFTPLRAYKSDVYNMLKEHYKMVCGLQSMSFVDGEDKNIDIILIGQQFVKDPLGKNAGSPGGQVGWFVANSAKGSNPFSSNEDVKGKSANMAILHSFPVDYFLGFNEKNPSYAGCDKPGKTRDLLTGTRRFWAYYKSGVTLDELRRGTAQPSEIFKPYLVLNDSCEEPGMPMAKNALTDMRYAFVNGCADVVEKASPGLWKAVRAKHLSGKTDENTYNDISLTDGISFEGLARRVASTTGKSVDMLDVLSTSKKVADFIASCMGYPSYRHLLFDLTPNGIFTPDAVVDAIANPASYTDIKKRAPMMAAFGYLGEDNADDMSGGVTRESWNNDGTGGTSAGFGMPDEVAPAPSPEQTTREAYEAQAASERQAFNEMQQRGANATQSVEEDELAEFRRWSVADWEDQLLHMVRQALVANPSLKRSWTAEKINAFVNSKANEFYNMLHGGGL